MITKEEIRKLREKKYHRCSVADGRKKMARVLLVAPRTVASWERGERTPRGLTLEKIKKLLIRCPATKGCEEPGNASLSRL